MKSLVGKKSIDIEQLLDVLQDALRENFDAQVTRYAHKVRLEFLQGQFFEVAVNISGKKCEKKGSLEKTSS